MKPKPSGFPVPDSAQTPATPAQAQRARHAESRDTLQALMKDARAVTAHAQHLHDQAQRAQDDARAARARGPVPPPGTPLTIPQACRMAGVCERTLRITLRRPDLAARLQQSTRKVGTFYKAIQLLPPDLVADLQAHFAARKKAAPALQ